MHDDICPSEGYRQVVNSEGVRQNSVEESSPTETQQHDASQSGEIKPSVLLLDIDGATLADQNPGCPDDDDVVIVDIEKILDKRIPSWDSREKEIPIKQLRDEDIPYDAFPSLRLVIVEWSHLRKELIHS